MFPPIFQTFLFLGRQSLPALVVTPDGSLFLRTQVTPLLGRVARPPREGQKQKHEQNEKAANYLHFRFLLASLVFDLEFRLGRLPLMITRSYGLKELKYLH